MYSYDDSEWLLKVKSVPIEDYASRIGYTPQRLGGQNGRYVTLKEHDSIRIDTQKNCFYWNSQGINGSIVDFAIHLGNCADAKEASNEVAKMYGIESKKTRGENYSESKFHYRKPQVAEKTVEEPKKVIYPQRAESMSKAWHYLVDERKIDKSVVEYFRRRGMLYQDTRNNCVFATKDYACLRSTGEKKFVADAKGCNYKEGFFFRGKSSENKPINQLFVAESVIDIMSVMSYRAMKGQQYSEGSAYLATGGTQKIDSVFNHLDKDPNIKTVFLCLDNDESGRDATNTIIEKIKTDYPTVEAKVAYPPKGKDWNEYMVGVSNQLEEKKEQTGQRQMAMYEKEIATKKENSHADTNNQRMNTRDNERGTR